MRRALWVLAALVTGTAAAHIKETAPALVTVAFAVGGYIVGYLEGRRSVVIEPGER